MGQIQCGGLRDTPGLVTLSCLTDRCSVLSLAPETDSCPLVSLAASNEKIYATYSILSICHLRFTARVCQRNPGQLDTGQLDTGHLDTGHFFFFYLPSSNRITHSAESAVTNVGSWQQYTKYP